VSEQAAYVAGRKDGIVRVGTEQVITREVESPERNARPRRCFDVAVEDLCFSLFETLISLSGSQLPEYRVLQRTRPDQGRIDGTQVGFRADVASQVGYCS
jgi:hypothetical protein